MTQEERQRTKERDQNEVESTSSMITEEVSIHRILEAESLSSPELTDDVKVRIIFDYVDFECPYPLKCVRNNLENHMF